MWSGCGDLERALGLGLAFDVGEVGVVVIVERCKRCRGLLRQRAAVIRCAQTSSSNFAGRTTASRTSAASPALAAGNTEQTLLRL